MLGREDYLDAARACAILLDASCATRTGACCAPTRTARAISTPTSRTMPSCSRRCDALRIQFEPRWFEAARDAAETMIERFGDPERGGFFSTS